MAQLIVATAGAVIGSFIPGVGPAIGWTPGILIGPDQASTEASEAAESMLGDRIEAGEHEHY